MVAPYALLHPRGCWVTSKYRARWWIFFLLLRARESFLFSIRERILKNKISSRPWVWAFSTLSVDSSLLEWTRRAYSSRILSKSHGRKHLGQQSSGWIHYPPSPANKAPAHKREYHHHPPPPWSLFLFFLALDCGARSVNPGFFSLYTPTQSLLPTLVVLFQTSCCCGAVDT